MAENVEITAGSGTTIAADDISNVKYQKVKLVDGTADSTAMIGGDATNGLDVDVTRVGGNVTVIQGTASNLKVASTLDAETTKVIGTINVAASQTIGVTQATAGNLNCTEASASAIKTAVEIMDDWDDSNYCNVNMNIAGADVSGTVPVPIRTADFELAGVTTHVKKYYTNAGAVTDGVVWSPAAGKRWYVTDIIINTSAAAVVTFEDDLAGGDSPVMKFELAANGGMVSNFNTPLFSGEDAADLLVTTSAGNIYITVTGYEI